MAEYVKTENGNIKADENGHPLVKDGEKEYSVDAIGANSKIAEAQGEAKKYRKRAQSAEQVVEKLDDYDVDVSELLESHRRAATMDDDHKKAFDDYKESTRIDWEAKLNKADENNTDLKARVFELTVTDRFSSSEVAKSLVYTPQDASLIFGNNFDIEDGLMVGKLNGNVIYSKEKPGEAAEFDEALQIMIDARPDKAQIIRSSGAKGVGSKPGSRPGRLDPSGDGLTGFDRIKSGLKKRG